MRLPALAAFGAVLVFMPAVAAPYENSDHGEGGSLPPLADAPDLVVAGSCGNSLTLVGPAEEDGAYNVTLTANCTLSITAAPSGTLRRFVFNLRQDATGGWTVQWPSRVRWPGGTPPPIDPTAGHTTMVTLTVPRGGAPWLGSY